MATNKKKYGSEVEGAVTTKDARKALEEKEAQKPDTYTGVYNSEIDSLLTRLESRQPFSYSASGDALFREYEERYAREANRAMKDTLGRASALTGGFANSYGVTAGSDAYNEQMSKLSSILPDLYKIAYEKYTDEGSDMQKLLTSYRNLENDSYGRYRDDVSDWQADVKRLSSAYESARDYEYDALRDERADEQWQREFDESVRQYEANLAEKQRQYDSDLAEKQRQYNITSAQKQSSGSGSGYYTPSEQKTIISTLEDYRKLYDDAKSDDERKSIINRARAYLSGLKYKDGNDLMFELVFGFPIQDDSDASDGEKSHLNLWYL